MLWRTVVRNILTTVSGVAIFATTLGAHTTFAATEYPLTLQNCGTEITITAPPQRSVSIGQNSSEILLLLGLADRMVGTATWVTPVLEAVASENEKVPRLAQTTASYETILGTNPDFIAAQFGMKEEAGTREQYADLDIPSYISPTSCALADATNADGARLTTWSPELLYQEITELAAIFDVADRGVKLIQDLKDREAAVRQKVAGVGTGLSMLFWFSSPEIAGDAWVAGDKGAAAYMMSVLGASNAVTSEEDWPLVSWEAIATADPTVIVLGTMERRSQPADDPANKLEFLKNDPLVSQLSAVTSDNLLLLEAQAMNPTLRTIYGLETVAEALEKRGLLK